jgi:PAS domain S-box-containing protein
MSLNEKSRTIKIDIRSLGYGRAPASDERAETVQVDYFNVLDYRFLFEHAYDAILLADDSGRVLASNSRARRFFGYEGDGLVGLSVRTLVAGVTDKLLSDVQRVIADGLYMRIQAFAAHRDESFTPVEIVVLGNRVRAPEVYCYLVRDIESRWRAEQKLLSAYHAMDNTDSGIGIADLNGVVTYANRTMAGLLAGGDETKVVGQELGAWFEHKGVVDPMLANIRKGHPWSGEQRLIVASRSAWLSISAVPDVNEDQVICGVVLSLRDTAERRRAEIAEYQAERNRIMMESLAGVCHALGQPATVLLTSIELLKLPGAKDPKVIAQMVDLCYDAVINLRDLLQKMNAKRMYVVEPYLSARAEPRGIVVLDDRAPEPGSPEAEAATGRAREPAGAA